MKRSFLILMMCLLPYQFAWAMVASYDTHSEQDTQAHFGHHGHQATENHTDSIDLVGDNEGDANTRAAKNHVHCGFLHLSCSELLSHDLPSFTPESNQYSNQYLFNYPSPLANALERPNWAAPI